MAQPDAKNAFLVDGTTPTSTCQRGIQHKRDRFLFLVVFYDFLDFCSTNCAPGLLQVKL